MRRIFLILVLLTLSGLVIGCGNLDVGKTSDQNIEKIADNTIICNSPYMRFGTSCCLDQNNNSICDDDEATAATEPAQPASTKTSTETTCKPTTELCDGVDNDCDGSVDEGIWSNKGRSCHAGSGECSRQGNYICDPTNPAGSTKCSVSAGSPTTEVCNGLDDDCDGSVDEGIWSNRGQPCSTTGIGECSRHGTYICDPTNPVGPTKCSVSAGSPTTEVCNGLDDDCDGSVDENWMDLGNVCYVGIGQCIRNGAYICDSDNPSGPVKCSVTPGTPSAETCNTMDDDCDGETDEGGVCIIRCAYSYDCDDNNVCTDDICGAGLCRNPTNTRSCDDADLCTTNDVCAAGTCTGGTAIDCDDHNRLTSDTCEPKTGCVHTVIKF